jgi:CMP-N,N'-diacetyllegionaminic acid synthase
LKKNIIVIILARGGSKGVPKKNLKKICGKPLVSWTIEHAIHTKGISSVWLSSDSDQILKVGKNYGINLIKRPKNISKDSSSSVSGWIHAINLIEKNEKIDIVIALQPTSPLRESKDIEKGLKEFQKNQYDSMFSGADIGDFYIWKKQNMLLKSINYNYKNRKRRQEIEPQYVENGSFFIFTPKIIKKYNNQLGGKIGISLMEFWKSFQIDDADDIEFCETIMKHYFSL